MTATSRALLRHPLPRCFAIALLLSLGGISSSAYAQERDNALHARLSPMPATAITVRTITGEGEVNATLSGNILSVTGSFKGMSSAATAAHIHQGPKAQPGPVVLSLNVDKAPSGAVSGELTLTPALIEALHAEGLYIQIHSDTNPGGELRGWLLH